MARAERLQPAVPGALRRVGRQRAAGRFRQFDPVQDAGERRCSWDRLANTGILALCVFAIMIPLSLVLGVLSGMREGSGLDRSISFVSILTTSVPEFASATFLVALFVFRLDWLPGTSSMTGGFNPIELVLPVAVLVLYDFGYVARMTRASMAEVMTSQYIRTAVLKGLPLPTGDHRPRLAQRADRAVHGDRAAAQLAAVRRDRGRGVLRLSTASASCSTTAPPSATSTWSRPARWSRCSWPCCRSSSRTSATPCSTRASGSAEDHGLRITDDRRPPRRRPRGWAASSAPLGAAARKPDRDDGRRPPAVLGEHGDPRPGAAAARPQPGDRSVPEPILDAGPKGDFFPGSAPTTRAATSSRA